MEGCVVWWLDFLESLDILDCLDVIEGKRNENCYGRIHCGHSSEFRGVLFLGVDFGGLGILGLIFLGAQIVGELHAGLVEEVLQGRDALVEA